MTNLNEELNVIETVELTIANPKVGTIINCSDPANGEDQKPVPVVTVGSDLYSVAKVTFDNDERDQVYWRDYATLCYYDDVIVEKDKKYTVFGKIIAAEGYRFYDPINLIVNGEELFPDATEDYSLAGDEFCFYADVDSASE
ncbi:MAG: hypothetical protein IKO97_10575 [Erysipelotrichaceae bacterium]|nr:hypothetical protein [Erysipelotrichaceae bacterium]